MYHTCLLHRVPVELWERIFLFLAVSPCFSYNLELACYFPARCDVTESTLEVLLQVMPDLRVLPIHGYFGALLGQVFGYPLKKTTGIDNYVCPLDGPGVVTFLPSLELSQLELVTLQLHDKTDIYD